MLMCLVFLISAIDSEEVVEVESPSCILVDDAEDDVKTVKLYCYSTGVAVVPDALAAGFTLDGSLSRLMDNCAVQPPLAGAANRTGLLCGRYEAGAYVCQCGKNGPRSNAIIKPALDPEPVTGTPMFWMENPVFYPIKT